MYHLEETKNGVTIKVNHQCGSCNGTGLYVGYAEHKGAAVVCHTCNGTGKHTTTMTFEKFKKRKTRNDVERVFHSSCGYSIGAKDVTTEDGQTIHFSKAGCAYKDWLKGAKPLPIKELYCPYLSENQQMQHSDHPAYSMYENRCRKHLTYGMISECKCWKEKEKCWEQFDKIMEK